MIKKLIIALLISYTMQMLGSADEQEYIREEKAKQEAHEAREEALRKRFGFGNNLNSEAVTVAQAQEPEKTTPTHPSAELILPEQWDRDYQKDDKNIFDPEVLRQKIAANPNYIFELAANYHNEQYHKFLTKFLINTRRLESSRLGTAIDELSTQELLAVQQIQYQDSNTELQQRDDRDDREELVTEVILRLQKEILQDTKTITELTTIATNKPNMEEWLKYEQEEQVRNFAALWKAEGLKEHEE